MLFTLPGQRLEAAAELVRPGAYVADIGTDHAYLPIYLVGRGSASRAVASDINRGPLERAASNIRAAGLSDRISLLLTDGVDGLFGLGVTDYLICGMGGELIASVTEAPFLRDPSVLLILQPMTKPEILRKSLLDRGFSIKDERLAEEAGRIYQIFSAAFTGVTEKYSDAELLLGRGNILRGGELYIRLANRETEMIRRRLTGKKSAGLDTSDDEALLSEIGATLK